MDIRPIRNEADYNWALAEIAQYFESAPGRGTDAADRFDVLASLIAAYEEQHWPIELPDPVEAIRYRMEIAGLQQEDLAELIGSKSQAAEILDRKRRLTLEMIHKLNQGWGIPAEVLIKPYDLDAA